MLMTAVVFVSCHPQDQKLADEDLSPERVVVGYVTSWSDRMPDPSLVTHLNYAFGHVIFHHLFITSKIIGMLPWIFYTHQVYSFLCHLHLHNLAPQQIVYTLEDLNSSTLTAVMMLYSIAQTLCRPT